MWIYDYLAPLVSLLLIGCGVALAYCCCRMLCRFAKIASDRLREAVVQITGKRSSTLALGVGGVGDAGEGSTNSSKRRRTKKKTARAVDAVECI